MSRTPDHRPGELYEDEGIRFSDVASDPTVEGEIKYNAGSFKAKDGGGVFNLRSGAAPIFGSEYQRGESLGIYTTSSSTFQQRWRFSTTDLPAGSYILLAFAEIGTDASSAGAQVEAQIQRNDAVTLAKGGLKPGVASARVLVGGAFHLNAISGVQNIDFDIRKVSGNGAVAMENARVILWRVS